MNLASAKGKTKRHRRVWNIYRQFRAGIHYYHQAPLNRRDVVVERDINPDRGIDIVNAYNKRVKEKNSQSSTNN